MMTKPKYKVGDTVYFTTGIPQFAKYHEGTIVKIEVEKLKSRFDKWNYSRDEIVWMVVKEDPSGEIHYINEMALL